MPNIISLEKYQSQAFINAFKSYYHDLGLDDFPHYERLFKDMEKEEGLKTFIIKEDNEIIAFIQLQPIILEHWFFKEYCGFIRELWVKGNYRKNKLGTDLVVFAKDYFMQLDLHKILLTTEYQQVFFKKLGFKQDLSYQALNKDEVLMCQLGV